MNAKMMMIDFCTKLPRAPVRRKTIMNVEYYNQSSIVVYLTQFRMTVMTGIGQVPSLLHSEDVSVKHKSIANTWFRTKGVNES